MGIDFFEMMKQEQKKQNKPADVQKETLGTTEPKNEKKPENKKNGAKKDVSSSSKKKVITFEEQYAKIKGTPVQKVIDHLLKMGMRELMEHPDVTISKMWEYVRAEAKKQAQNGCAMIDDDEVYGWGRHYYDEHGNVAG